MFSSVRCVDALHFLAPPRVTLLFFLTPNPVVVDEVDAKQSEKTKPEHNAAGEPMCRDRSHGGGQGLGFSI